ncbi:MAG: succinylglutamate desuccinylase/aspartoacylase family protein [Patescibacteria group bacterium]|nr:MAG: succinylglutamate desuccinylase/aspartoacylase family protein [Patescibacteria group bacterium]
MIEKPSADTLAISLQTRAWALGLEAYAHRLEYARRPGKVRMSRAGEDPHAAVASYAPYQWPLLEIDDRRWPDAPIVLITATMHGDEIAGALTLYHRFEEIVQIASEARLALLCFPLVNPSGFENGERYGMDGAPPEGNNDYLRYRTFGGEWIWDLREDHSITEWRWSSDPTLPNPPALPAETRLMHERLKLIDWPRVVAAIDLHQDRITPGVGPGAYHYGYGDLGRYADIVSRIAKRVPILADRDFGVDLSQPTNTMRTDARGFIVRHDGTSSDLWHRLGVPHAIVAETSGATPLEDVIEVNMEWIRGLCRLATQRRP